MIAFLILHGFADAPNPRIVYSVPQSENACFDLKYQGDGEPLSLTHNNEGFYVGYRLYNDEGAPLQINLLKKSQEFSETDSIKVKFSYEYEEAFPSYLKVIFNASNSDYFPRTIDLGVFVDSNFNGDTNSALKIRGQGFTVTGNDRHYTVFTKEFLDHISVNNTWLGSITRPEQGEIPVENMKFFSKGGGSEVSGKDTMYAFSWIKRTILPETTVTFIATFAPNDNVNTPTDITDITQYGDYWNYYPGQELEFKFNVADVDYNQEVIVKISLNGTESEDKITFTENKKVATITKSFTLPEEGSTHMHIIAYATDSKHIWASNKIDKIVPFVPPPYVDKNTLTGLKQKYKPSDTISFKIKAFSYFVPGKLKYQFDDAKVETYDHDLKIETNVDPNESEDQFVSGTIPIPSPIARKGGEHNIKIWAENTIGQSTLKEDPNFGVATASFRLNIDPPPQLTESGFSSKVTSAGDTLIGYIVAKVKTGTKFHIFIKLGINQVRIDGFESKSDDLTPYAFFYTVPNQKYGTYDVRIYVEADESGDDSEYSYNSIYLR